MTQYKNIIDSIALLYLIVGGVIMGGVANYLRQNNKAKYWRFLIVQIIGFLLIAFYYFVGK